MTTFDSIIVTGIDPGAMPNNRIELHKNDDGSWRLSFIGNHQWIKINFPNKRQLVNLAKLLPKEE